MGALCAAEAPVYVVRLATFIQSDVIMAIRKMSVVYLNGQRKAGAAGAHVQEAVTQTRRSLQRLRGIVKACGDDESRGSTKVR